MIEVRQLSKTYRTTKKQPGLSGALRGLFRRETELTHAVKEVSFNVEEGELVGFLGPNGAGKITTLIKLRLIATASASDRTACKCRCQPMAPFSSAPSIFQAQGLTDAVSHGIFH
ncbi:MAG: ATP-binding cassette domain-containing protein [Verrucomicrobiae bacterium]|nr:ATP-binding cassette domain-containing protein [Verrucomicrobiae bacterium]